MILTADYHTHTPFSHGRNTVDENTAKAKELGLKQIGISDHGFSHVAFGIRRRQVLECVRECKEASKKYGLDVLVGIEANIRGISGKADLKKSDYENFDIYLCGKHVFIWYDTFSDMFQYGAANYFNRKDSANASKKLIKRNTLAYINTIKNNPIDAITHLNFLTPANALEVAKCAADYGTYIELNSKKDHLTDEELCEIVAKTDARFIIGSDAHSADRVGEISRVETQLSRVNFPMERIDNIDGRYPSFRFAQFKKNL